MSIQFEFKFELCMIDICLPIFYLNVTLSHYLIIYSLIILIDKIRYKIIKQFLVECQEFCK